MFLMIEFSKPESELVLEEIMIILKDVQIKYFDKLVYHIIYFIISCNKQIFYKSSILYS